MALTIRDVAKAAGVSTATVSNVLNKTGKVGRRTHHIVLSAVKRLGYFPNAHARHLASRDSRTLGIIVSDIVNRTHTGQNQEQALLAAELVLKAQKDAKVLTFTT